MLPIQPVHADCAQNPLWVVVYYQSFACALLRSQVAKPCLIRGVVAVWRRLAAYTLWLGLVHQVVKHNELQFGQLPHLELFLRLCHGHQNQIYSMPLFDTKNLVDNLLTHSFYIQYPLRRQADHGHIGS